MAYDRQHIRLTASGTLGPVTGPQEIWSWSLKFSGAPEFLAAPKLLSVDIDAVTAAVSDFHSATNSWISPDAFLDQVKLAAIGTNGHYIPDTNSRVGADFFGVAGGNNAFRHPNQIALVVSLRTVLNQGLATKGRVYLPLPSMQIAPSGHIMTNSDTLSVRTAFVDMVNALNTIFKDTGGGAEQAILQLMSDVGAGKSRAVTIIRVGDVLDTMRSRRNALVESYASQAVAP